MPFPECLTQALPRPANVPEFENPYPGARPLRPTESGLLLGREQKLIDVIDAIRSVPVIEFTAPSGLGKSSLLEAGVLPRLDAEGFAVAPLRSWAGLSPATQGVEDDSGPRADYYAEAVRAAVHEGGIDDGGLSGQELLDFLAETHGSTLVVIFDQFEELLRDDPTLGRRFLERVVIAARTLPFHQVISMRSEFKEELRGLEERLRYNQWIWVRLEEVNDEIASDIVVAPLGSAPPFSWEPAGVNRIAHWWRAARRKDWKIGLLHLQAFLWSIVEQLEPSDGTIITDRAVKDLVSRWLMHARGAEGGEDVDPPVVFRAALAVYVDLRLGTPSKTRDAELRQSLYAASRYSAELSSAGYKLVRDTLELGRFAFPGVKGELSFSERFIEEAVRSAESLLVAGDVRATLMSMATTLPQRLREREAEGELPLEEGDPEGTAGAMASASPLDAACSEIAAYERSLQFLADRSLVRLTPTLGGGRRVALIHDGFGDAIEAWGKKVGRDPLAAIESTTALSAKQLLEGLGDDGLSISRLAVTGKDAIENVRWIGCYITANIRGVLFRNCRFSSTLFKNCIFENVHFENCEFRGALFWGCTFTGTKGTVIEVVDEGLRDRCRISAVTVKQCRMTEEGLTFAGMIGSGLLFEECEGGPWTLSRCTLRHVSLDGASDRVQPEPLWGRIEGCESILHLSIRGAVAEETVVEDSKIRLATYPKHHRLVSKGRTDLRLTSPEPE
jgi:hypothetical protein